MEGFFMLAGAFVLVTGIYLYVRFSDRKQTPTAE